MNINIYEYEKKIINDDIREYCKAERVNEAYLRSSIRGPKYNKGGTFNMKNNEGPETKKNTDSNTLLDINRIKIIAYIILAISSMFVVATTGWVLSENRNVLIIMEILTMCSALAVVLLFAEMYKGSSENKKSQGLIALILSSCMATLTIINHFLYMTVLNQISGMIDIPSWMLLDSWPSVTKGVECASWGLLLGLAILFASRVIEDTGSKLMIWTMRISGVMTIAGLIGPVIGNMSFYFLSTAGYSIGFLLISIEMIVYLNKKSKLSHYEVLI